MQPQINFIIDASKALDTFAGMQERAVSHRDYMLDHAVSPELLNFAEKAVARIERSIERTRYRREMYRATLDQPAAS